MMLLGGSRTIKGWSRTTRRRHMIKGGKAKKPGCEEFGNLDVRVFDENVFLSEVRPRSPASSPNTGGSCTVIPKPTQRIRSCFATLVRGREVSHFVPFVLVGWGRWLQRV